MDVTLWVMALGLLTAGWWAWRWFAPPAAFDLEAMRRKIAALPPAERDFTSDQRQALLELAKHLGHRSGIDYQVLGFVNHGETETGVTLLEALAAEDWASARAHASFPVGDMLKAVALRLSTDPPTCHWALLLCPDDLYGGASVVTHQGAETMPDGTWEMLKA